MFVIHNLLSTDDMDSRFETLVKTPLLCEQQPESSCTNGCCQTVILVTATISHLPIPLSSPSTSLSHWLAAILIVRRWLIIVLSQERNLHHQPSIVTQTQLLSRPTTHHFIPPPQSPSSSNICGAISLFCHVLPTSSLWGQLCDWH